MNVRSLKRSRLPLVVLSLALCVTSCSRYSAGDKVVLDRGGLLIPNLEEFQSAAKLAKAGERFSFDVIKASEREDRPIYLSHNCTVKVIESVTGGALVKVTDTDRAGAIGYVLDGDMAAGK
jgi:hypothetical protein